MVNCRCIAAQIIAIEWIHLTPDTLRSLQSMADGAAAAGGYAAAASWTKLALGRLLPPDVQRALYMDCDMLATTSLQPLLSTGLQGVRTVEGGAASGAAAGSSIAPSMHPTRAAAPWL